MKRASRSGEEVWGWRDLVALGFIVLLAWAADVADRVGSFRRHLSYGR